jgi:hypothetical protein
MVHRSGVAIIGFIAAIALAPDPRWNDANIDMLKRIKGSDFEVVLMTGMVIGTP